jgi:hypothetical protein
LYPTAQVQPSNDPGPQNKQINYYNGISCYSHNPEFGG